MDKKIITDHFRRNIFEAFSHYNAWKMIAYSKSSGVVSQKMAERYVLVQSYHNAFFFNFRKSISDGIYYSCPPSI